MEELDILRIIAENPDISQRKISKQTGISLGQVNFIIKKCVKKGFVKIEGQTSKSISYNLTPKGFAEKANLMLEYIKLSYGAVVSLTEKIRTTAWACHEKEMRIVVYESHDEMMEIVKLALNAAQIPWEFYKEDMYENNGHSAVKGDDRRVLFYWDAVINENLKDLKMEVINLLD